jgi:serine/threonine-protein kinase
MIELGKRLGNFLIERKIGSGGMGTIYVAIDTMLNRKVALKIIHPELSHNSRLMELFKVEAKMQAQMNHPNIVTIFYFNKIKDECVIVMEYVDGTSLKEILRGGTRFSVMEAVNIFKQVLRGLHYAHSRNIIHRDIKPANILVTKDKRIKLSDFGIAKILGTAEIEQDGMVMATPCYTSPEIIQGKEVDSRSDLYSVGVTFYEMLTGTAPFNCQSSSDRELQRQHLKAIPQPPSRLNPEIGPRMDAFILKVLEKRPENRFQSAGEMLMELDQEEGLIKDD